MKKKLIENWRADFAHFKQFFIISRGLHIDEALIKKVEKIKLK